MSGSIDHEATIEMIARALAEEILTVGSLSKAFHYCTSTSAITIKFDRFPIPQDSPFGTTITLNPAGTRCECCQGSGRKRVKP